MEEALRLLHLPDFPQFEAEEKQRAFAAFVEAMIPDETKRALYLAEKKRIEAEEARAKNG